MQGLIPVIVTVRPDEDLSVKSTESVADPGKPLTAVALMIAVFEMPGNSDPKLVRLEDKTTTAIVGEEELSNVAPVCAVSLTGFAVPLAIVTQVLETLVTVHPVWNPTDIGLPALLAPVML